MCVISSGAMTSPNDKPPAIKAFRSESDFRLWLTKNHTKTEGLWLRIFKKDSGVASLTYAQALDQALCFGWIDGQKKSYDSQSWIQKFTPRRARSQWSKINREHVARLIKDKKMTGAGLRQIEAAKADGRWEAAYDSFSSARVPDDFLKLLAKNKKAQAFFETLNKTNLYAIAYRLQTAKKPETRERRVKLILKMLSEGKTFH